MNDIEKAIEKLLVPRYIPAAQQDHYLQKRKEKEENEVYEQNLDVQNT